jgi:hypothetical protein
MLTTLIRTIVSGPIHRLRLVGEMGAELNGDFFQFEDQTWPWPVTGSGEQLGEIPEGLLVALTEQPASALLVDAIVGERRLRCETSCRRHTGFAAVIYHAIRTVPRSTNVICIVPARLATASDFRHLRAEIEEEHHISWLLHVDGAAMGTHPSLDFLVLVCRGASHPIPATRLVDLRGCDGTQGVAAVTLAAERQGGEGERFVVHRRTPLGHESWAYERFTESYRRAQEDNARFGEFRPLSEFVEGVFNGIAPARAAGLIRIPDDADDPQGPEGTVPVLGARQVHHQLIELSGRYWTELDSVPETQRLRDGDVLVRQLCRKGPHGAVIVAATVAPGTRAAFEQGVLCLRWRAEVSLQIRELLLAWLTSDRGSRAISPYLSSMGAVCHLKASDLLCALVPRPHESILQALMRLADIESWYQHRASVVHAARDAIFSAEEYGAAIPTILETQRRESEMVAAAEDSQLFEYRVRNYFPHPIALRREGLAVHPHGETRLRETLECAEHCVHFLAVCALAQLRALSPSAPVPRQYRQSGAYSALRFSWGGSWDLVRHVAAITKKSGDVLRSPFPEFGQLAGVVSDQANAVVRAEASLRQQRNVRSHLHRELSTELARKSEELAIALDTLLEAMSFLADRPLVRVRDYSLDRFTHERTAEVDFLQGASTVFRRRRRRVGGELPRDSLGVFGHDGEFYSLSPWLVSETCDECKHSEIFIFSRLEDGIASYVAMESGHSRGDARMAGVLEAILTAPPGGDVDGDVQ